MVERIGVRGKERGRIATAYSFPRKNFKMNGFLFQDNIFQENNKNGFSVKIFFESVSYNPKNHVAGKREKAQRRRPRFPLPRVPHLPFRPAF